MEKHGIPSKQERLEAKIKIKQRRERKIKTQRSRVGTIDSRSIPGAVGQPRHQSRREQRNSLPFRRSSKEEVNSNRFGLDPDNGGIKDTDHMKWEMNLKSQHKGCALEDRKDQRDCEENLMAINRTVTNAHRNMKAEHAKKGTNENAWLEPLREAPDASNGHEGTLDSSVKRETIGSHGTQVATEDTRPLHTTTHASNPECIEKGTVCESYTPSDLLRATKRTQCGEGRNNTVDHDWDCAPHSLSELDKYLSTAEVSPLNREDVKLLDDLNEFLEDGQQQKAASEQDDRRYGILLELGKDETLEHASREIRRLFERITYGFLLVKAAENPEIIEEQLRDLDWVEVDALVLLTAEQKGRNRTVLEASELSKLRLYRRKQRGTNGLSFYPFSFFKHAQSNVIAVSDAQDKDEMVLAGMLLLKRLLGDTGVTLYFSSAPSKLKLGKEFEYYPLREVEQVEKMNRIIRAHSLTDEQVKSLGEKNAPQQILFQNMGDNFPSKIAREIGYGENTELDSTERLQIFEAIQKHMDGISSKEAEKMGFKEDQLKLVHDILKKNYRAFGLETSIARMSNLTPISVQLKDGHVPCLARGRVMPSQEEQIFLQNKLADLTRMGIVRPAKNPVYGCTAFTVPKKGPKKYRMVIDMRPLNDITVRTALQLPHLEQQMGFVGRAGIFTAFDVLSGFDFLETQEESRRYFNIITPHGAFTMCGAPMGWVNTPAMFQERLMTEILQPAGLYAKMDVGVCQWIDDTLMYADNPENYLKALEAFLQQVIRKGVRLNIRKLELLKSEIAWCGRILSKGRWRFDTKFFDKVLAVPRPRYCHELAQVLYIITWMSTSIPNLTQYRDYFKNLVDLNGGTLKKLARQRREIKWTQDLYQKWLTFLTELHYAARNALANYDPRRGIVLLMDASEQ